MLTRTISGIILVGFMLFMIAFDNITSLILWGFFAILTIVEFIRLTMKYGNKLGFVKNRIIAVLGVVYILLGYGLLAFGFDNFSRMFIITIMTLIWSNDVGAYLIGSSIGRHKMAPKISPKKSWEGFIGGVVCSVVVAAFWSIMFWEENPNHLPMSMLWDDKFIFFIGLGVVCAIGSVLGDLLESKYKRMIGVKDSGKIIPGHGGMLDRFDALLMTVPLVYIYVWLF